jgi:hypothetical protein
VTIEQRRAILRAEIEKAARKGWRVVSQTDAAAQLVKPREFSATWAFLWFLACGVGLVVYLLYYAGKRDQQLYLDVDVEGTLHWSYGAAWLTRARVA